MGNPVGVGCVPSQGYPRHVRARNGDYPWNLHKLHRRFFEGWEWPLSGLGQVARASDMGDGVNA
jgi:predicted choloylglycine hydrolase